MMYALVAILLLLLVPHTLHSQPRFALTPEIPPTAFLNQNYACLFQVTGLDSPLFIFKGLPKDFSWESSGIIKGRPSAKGSFLVNVSFWGNNYKGSRQTIIRVAVPSKFPVIIDLPTVPYPSFSISANIDTYVFMAGT